MKGIYLAVSFVVFVASVVAHVWTRIRFVDPTLLWTLLAAATLLCVPLAVLYVRVSRTYREELGIWDSFWCEAYRDIPKWLFPLSGIAALNLVVLLVRDLAGYPSTIQAFPSSSAPILSAVAFTHACSLMMRKGRKAAEPGATDNPDDAQRLREDH